jgi:hypothetical protein
MNEFMKKIKSQILVLAWLIMAGGIANAQIDTLHVSDGETTYLVFSEAVDLVDIGRPGEYFARIEGQSVFLKAKSNLSRRTNILVRHGQNYYTAVLDYTVSPRQHLYDFRAMMGFKEQHVEGNSKGEEVNYPRLRKHLKMISGGKENIRGLRSSRNGIKIKVTYLKNDRDATYLGIAMANNSSIAYQLDFVGFSLEEKRGRKFSRNNLYEQDILPLQATVPKVIPAGGGGRLYYALPLYAMTSRGKLNIIFRESSGSRTIELSIPAREINNADTF